MSKVVLKLGDDVSTDIIFPGRFMATVLPTETPQYVFADLVDFNKRVKNHEVSPQSVIVAGNNFGCGSSRTGGFLPQGSGIHCYRQGFCPHISPEFN